MKTLVTLISVTILLFSFVNLSTVSAQSEGEVGVTASVTGCGARILVRPEKRIPTSGNFSNKNTIIFYDELYQELYKFENVETDNDGYANLEFCSQGLNTKPGIFSIYVKGYSHLGKLFIENKGFFNYTTFFDLAKTEDDYLLAGDVTGHDYINGLDFNGVVSKLYTNDTKMDLNKDGMVNSLDLSNQIYNLHKVGQLRL